MLALKYVLTISSIVQLKRLRKTYADNPKHCGGSSHGVNGSKLNDEFGMVVDVGDLTQGSNNIVTSKVY